MEAGAAEKARLIYYVEWVHPQSPSLKRSAPGIGEKYGNGIP